MKWFDCSCTIKPPDIYGKLLCVLITTVNILLGTFYCESEYFRHINLSKTNNNPIPTLEMRALSRERLSDVDTVSQMRRAGTGPLTLARPHSPCSSQRRFPAAGSVLPRNNPYSRPGGQDYYVTVSGSDRISGVDRTQSYQNSFRVISLN